MVRFPPEDEPLPTVPRSNPPDPEMRPRHLTRNRSPAVRSRD